MIGQKKHTCNDVCFLDYLMNYPDHDSIRYHNWTYDVHMCNVFGDLDLIDKKYFYLCYDFGCDMIKITDVVIDEYGMKKDSTSIYFTVYEVCEFLIDKCNTDADFLKKIGYTTLGSVHLNDKGSRSRIIAFLDILANYGYVKIEK